MITMCPGPKASPKINPEDSNGPGRGCDVLVSRTLPGCLSGIKKENVAEVGVDSLVL